MFLRNNKPVKRNKLALHIYLAYKRVTRLRSAARLGPSNWRGEGTRLGAGAEGPVMRPKCVAAEPIARWRHVASEIIGKGVSCSKPSGPSAKREGAAPRSCFIRQNVFQLGIEKHTEIACAHSLVSISPTLTRRRAAEQRDPIAVS